MAYSELIKNFARIRSYMRDFYVYGFKSRNEYDQKSSRSYDNERRRMESWLGDYMAFRQSAAGKNVFLTIDPRCAGHNPLYKALKAKSFTDGDITLHFILLDILHNETIALSIQEVAERIDRDYLSRFQNSLVFDESTLRKKLKEYVAMGLLQREKQGRQLLYRRSMSPDLSGWWEAISFFTEGSIAGAPGSYLLDREEIKDNPFVFKHHYITPALETEVLCRLLIAMGEKRSVTICNYSRRAKEERAWEVVPLRIFVSVQSGRRYLLAKNPRLHSFISYRLDYITKVEPGEIHPNFDALRQELAQKQRHMWGVICDEKRGRQMERVEFTLHIGEDEEHIWDRLYREKRCGTVIRLDARRARFCAEVYDSGEMIPWIRSFFCRITDIHFSNKETEALFRQDFDGMCALYGLGGEET